MFFFCCCLFAFLFSLHFFFPHFSHISPLCIPFNSCWREFFMWQFNTSHSYSAPVMLKFLIITHWIFVNTARKYFIMLRHIPFETERSNESHLPCPTFLVRSYEANWWRRRRKASNQRVEYEDWNICCISIGKHTKWMSEKKTKVTVRFDWISTTNKSIRPCVIFHFQSFFFYFARSIFESIDALLLNFQLYYFSFVSLRRSFMCHYIFAP